MENERKHEHSEFTIHKPTRNPLPTFFPIFSDTRIQSSDLNKFTKTQLKYLNEGGTISKTVLNTGSLDAAVVPYTFLKNGLIIHERNHEKLRYAMQTARKLHGLVKQKKLSNGKDKDYIEIQQQYVAEQGEYFKPIVCWTISHHYPAVILEKGYMVAQTVAGYPSKHFCTEIRIVAKGYRNYAEIGINFIEKHHCCFCLLSPKWEPKQGRQYRFFVDASHQNCPFVKK